MKLLVILFILNFLLPGDFKNLAPISDGQKGNQALKHMRPKYSHVSCSSCRLVYTK